MNREKRIEVSVYMYKNLYYITKNTVKLTKILLMKYVIMCSL